MSERHPGDSGDDFSVEVSDTRTGATAGTTLPERPPLAPRRTPRQRAARLALVVSAVLLALAVTTGTVPGLRQRLFGPATAFVTAPTVAPGSDLFYLLPNPPGVDVALDGQVLVRVPFPGDPQPLRLARGHHTFTWRSRLLPFQPLRCQVSVPPAPGDTCPFVSRGFTPPDLANRPGAIIALHASLAALDTAEADQLGATILAALDAHPYTGIVQPGERYFSSPQGSAGGGGIATAPLRATLTYHFLPISGYPEPCILGQPAIPCRFPGQDCGQLCTVALPPASLANPPSTWVVAATVGGTWTYTTLDGQVVDENDGGGGLAIQLAALRITWDAAGWHVAPILGYTPGLAVADDAVCDTARDHLASNPVWSFMLDDPPPGARVQLASGANPTDGCVAVLDQAPGQVPPAIFLERFGVLATVNDAAASNSFAGLPTADPAEQALAQRLMAPLSGAP